MHIAGYVILCVIAGLLGRHTRIGFWGVTAASLIFTPLIVLLVVVLLSPPNDVRQ